MNGADRDRRRQRGVPAGEPLESIAPMRRIEARFDDGEKIRAIYQTPLGP